MWGPHVIFADMGELTLCPTRRCHRSFALLFRISDQGNQLAREACKVTLLNGRAAAETHRRLARGVAALKAFARRRRGGATTGQISSRAGGVPSAQPTPLLVRVVDDNDKSVGSAATEKGENICGVPDRGMGRNGSLSKERQTRWVGSQVGSGTSDEGKDDGSGAFNAVGI